MLKIPPDLRHRHASSSSFLKSSSPAAGRDAIVIITMYSTGVVWWVCYTVTLPLNGIVAGAEQEEKTSLHAYLSSTRPSITLHAIGPGQRLSTALTLCTLLSVARWHPPAPPPRGLHANREAAPPKTG